MRVQVMVCVWHDKDGNKAFILWSFLCLKYIGKINGRIPGIQIVILRNA